MSSDLAAVSSDLAAVESFSPANDRFAPFILELTEHVAQGEERTRSYGKVTACLAQLLKALRESQSGECIPTQVKMLVLLWRLIYTCPNPILAGCVVPIVVEYFSKGDVAQCIIFVDSLIAKSLICPSDKSSKLNSCLSAPHEDTCAVAVYLASEVAVKVPTHLVNHVFPIMVRAGDLFLMGSSEANRCVGLVSVGKLIVLGVGLTSQQRLSAIRQVLLRGLKKGNSSTVILLCVKALYQVFQTFDIAQLRKHADKAVLVVLGILLDRSRVEGARGASFLTVSETNVMSVQLVALVLVKQFRSDKDPSAQGDGSQVSAVPMVVGSGPVVASSGPVVASPHTFSDDEAVDDNLSDDSLPAESSSPTGFKSIAAAHPKLVHGISKLLSQGLMGPVLYGTTSISKLLEWLFLILRFHAGEDQPARVVGEILSCCVQEVPLSSQDFGEVIKWTLNNFDRLGHQNVLGFAKRLRRTVRLVLQPSHEQELIGQFSQLYVHEPLSSPRLHGVAQFTYQFLEDCLTACPLNVVSEALVNGFDVLREKSPASEFMTRLPLASLTRCMAEIGRNYASTACSMLVGLTVRLSLLQQTNTGRPFGGVALAELWTLVACMSTLVRSAGKGLPDTIVEKIFKVAQQLIADGAGAFESRNIVGISSGISELMSKPGPQSSKMAMSHLAAQVSRKRTFFACGLSLLDSLVSVVRSETSESNSSLPSALRSSILDSASQLIAVVTQETFTTRIQRGMSALVSGTVADAKNPVVSFVTVQDVGEGICVLGKVLEMVRCMPDELAVSHEESIVGTLVDILLQLSQTSSSQKPLAFNLIYNAPVESRLQVYLETRPDDPTTSSDVFLCEKPLRFGVCVDSAMVSLLKHSMRLPKGKKEEAFVNWLVFQLFGRLGFVRIGFHSGMSPRSECNTSRPREGFQTSLDRHTSLGSHTALDSLRFCASPVAPISDDSMRGLVCCDMLLSDPSLDRSDFCSAPESSVPEFAFSAIVMHLATLCSSGSGLRNSLVKLFLDKLEASVALITASMKTEANASDEWRALRDHVAQSSRGLYHTPSEYSKEVTHLGHQLAK